MEQSRNNIFTKSDEEVIKILARWWKMSEDELRKPFKVIASFNKADKRDKNNQEYGYFTDVRNLNGDILYYPPKFGQVKIYSIYKDGFMSSDIWQINVKLAPRWQREKYRNPFMLTLDNAIVGKPKVQFLDKLKKEKLIRKIFEETGSTERDAKNTSNALHAIMGDLYTETERFVFELLQNADDQPENGAMVKVKLKTLEENLLFLHTGKPFSEDDVESISSIGDSTKKKDTGKTGYKGIGFKSVFSDADTVYIDSGNFSFAFDKNSPLYPEGANMDEIPWQIKPIWEERYRLPKEIQKEDLFFSEPVGIALNVGREKIATYNSRISELLLKPQFTLFLRNVEEISFESKDCEPIIIKKQTSDSGIVEIKSNTTIENWITKDYIIDIPEETRDAIQNEKLIPAKLKECTKTKITFAAKIVDRQIMPIDDSVLYNYLPTKEKGYGYKFMVNADFLTVANRESIHQKNVWNRFLFENIGKLLVDWVKTLNDYDGAISLLPQEDYDGENLLCSDFYESFKNTISNSCFIKGHKGEILSQQEIMLDKSGLSKIIGKDLFCQIVDSSKSLPFNEADEKALKDSEIYQGITRITSLSILEKLYNNSLFNNWFAKSEEEIKRNFYDWLIKKNTDKRKASIIKAVSSLPIYKFGNEYVSKKDATDSLDKIVIRNEHSALVPIYEACGIQCSENIDTLPISIFYSDDIVKLTFEYIFNHLRNNVKFHTWLFAASKSDIKILTDWLDGQDTDSLRHNLLVDFVEALPIIVFNDKNCKRSDIIKKVKKHISKGTYIVEIKVDELDKTRLIITNKLVPIVDILNKVGFLCSENIEKSPLIKYFNLPKELDLFNLIKDKAREALSFNNKVITPTEKLSLFKVIKELNGVDNTKLAQTLLFKNQANTRRRWLSAMTSFSSDIPTWMHEYTICEEENFSEIIPYLVKKERIFEDIIKKNIEELIKTVSLKELYSIYKESWTLLFTQELINGYGTSESVLEMVEQQDVNSKKYFLQKLAKLPIDTTYIYKPEDYVYRIIALAFEVYDSNEVRAFANKLYVGDQPVSSYTISDNIILEYHEGKKLTLPLAKLLVSYKESGMACKIKSSLSNFSDTQLEQLLSLKPMSITEVWNRIDKSKGYTPYSYLLGIHYTRNTRNVADVDLSQVSQTWVHQLLNIMYEQKVELFYDSFGYRLSKYFDIFFNNDFINPNEKILDSIELWADCEDKKSYLVKYLDVKTEQAPLIKFRKSLVNNEKIETADIEKQKNEIISTINYLKYKNLLPLTGKNQIDTLLQLEPYNRYLSKIVDIDLLKNSSREYELEEYKRWKDDNTIRVYLYENKMPRKLIKTNDDNLLLCRFNDGDYYYDPQSKILYICQECEIRDILYNIVSTNSIPFYSTDWQQLYYDNLVSKNEVEKKEQEIDKLKYELQKYIDKYGDLFENDSFEVNSERKLEETNNHKNTDAESKEVSDSDMINKKHDEAEVKNHGNDIEKGDIDKEARGNINREARYAAKDYLENKEGIDCSLWNPDDTSHIVKNIIKCNGKPITVVITSSVSRKLYLHPWAFAELMEQPQNLLLNYGSDKRIHSLSFDDIFKDNPHVNLIFDTDVVQPSKIAELANKFMGSKKTCFVIENPKYSQSDAIKSFGLNEKKEDYVEIDFSDDDIFSF